MVVPLSSCDSSRSHFSAVHIRPNAVHRLWRIRQNEVKIVQPLDRAVGVLHVLPVEVHGEGSNRERPVCLDLFIVARRVSFRFRQFAGASGVTFRSVRQGKIGCTIRARQSSVAREPRCSFCGFLLAGSRRRPCSDTREKAHANDLRFALGLLSRLKGAKKRLTLPPVPLS